MVVGIGVALAAFFVPHAYVWWLDPAVAGLAAAAVAFIVVLAARGAR
jgi:membrane glycosyltransferase